MTGTNIYCSKPVSKLCAKLLLLEDKMFSECPNKLCNCSCILTIIASIGYVYIYNNNSNNNLYINYLLHTRRPLITHKRYFYFCHNAHDYDSFSILVSI